MTLKLDAKPICEPVMRRSPKEEESDRTAMEKLLKMVAMEPAVSPLAANNVSVRKKDGEKCVTSDFRGLSDLEIIDSYPIKNLRDTLDWLDTKKVF